MIDTADNVKTYLSVNAIIPEMTYILDNEEYRAKKDANGAYLDKNGEKHGLEKVGGSGEFSLTDGTNTAKITDNSVFTLQGSDSINVVVNTDTKTAVLTLKSGSVPKGEVLMSDGTGGVVFGVPQSKPITDAAGNTYDITVDGFGRLVSTLVPKA